MNYAFGVELRGYVAVRRSAALARRDQTLLSSTHICEATEIAIGSTTPPDDAAATPFVPFHFTASRQAERLNSETDESAC